MTTEQVILQTKLTALNKIKKMYHPKYTMNYDRESSYGDQRDSAISEIIENLNKELDTIRKKSKV